MTIDHKSIKDLMAKITEVTSFRIKKLYTKKYDDEKNTIKVKRNDHKEPERSKESILEKLLLTN